MSLIVRIERIKLSENTDALAVTIVVLADRVVAEMNYSSARYKLCSV